MVGKNTPPPSCGAKRIKQTSTSLYYIDRGLQTLIFIGYNFYLMFKVFQGFGQAKTAPDGLIQARDMVYYCPRCLKK